MYLPEHCCRELLRYISNIHVSTTEKNAFAAVVIYDPIIGNKDRFGQVMVCNLQKAGILSKQQKQKRQEVEEEDGILGLEATTTLSSQLNRLTECNFHKVVACDMLSAYYNNGVIRSEDVKKASQCEMLDELEEFQLLMKHYCFCMGVVAKDGDSAGYNLVEVGVDSVMGFRDGCCISTQTLDG